MPLFVQFVKYSWVPPTISAMSAYDLTSTVNETLDKLQKQGAKIADIRPSYLPSGKVGFFEGVVTMILYEANKAI